MDTVPHLSKGYHAYLGTVPFLSLDVSASAAEYAAAHTRLERASAPVSKVLHNLRPVQEYREQHKMTARSVVHSKYVLWTLRRLS